MLSLLSVSVLALRSPVLPLPQPLCLSPGLPPQFTSHDCRRLTASLKSESWNRWNMNGSVVYEKGVWVKEVVQGDPHL